MRHTTNVTKVGRWHITKQNIRNSIQVKRIRPILIVIVCAGDTHKHRFMRNTIPIRPTKKHTVRLLLFMCAVFVATFTEDINQKKIPKTVIDFRISSSSCTMTLFSFHANSWFVLIHCIERLRTKFITSKVFHKKNERKKKIKRERTRESARTVRFTLFTYYKGFAKFGHDIKNGHCH